jgi:hypothetical protein
MNRISRWLEPGEPLSLTREWRRADGETLYALHPLYSAMCEHYAADLPFDSAVKVVKQRLQEIARGERRLPPAVGEQVIEIDREHQAGGCPDENIAGLVALLQESGR